MKTKNLLTIHGDQFRMNGEPFDMWGIRVASAAQTPELTVHLIAQLDDYLRYGVNTVTVFYQGCSGLAADPFTPDGAGIESGHRERMERIIRACDDRGMAVIVGIFYQRSQFGLKDADAVHRAVRTVASGLKGYGNVIINIANEQSSKCYGKFRDVFDFTDPLKILELCRIVKGADPDRYVGCGGYRHPQNAVIGSSPDCDVLLFDTIGIETNAWDTRMETMYPWLREQGVTGKPAVNVEIFGGWTKRFTGGVYPDEAKRIHYEEIDAVARQQGLYLFFHSNAWCQSEDRPRRFDLGGAGTADDPGIRWYFEYVDKLRVQRTAMGAGRKG